MKNTLDLFPSNENKDNPHNIKCGYPLCRYYSPDAEVLDCPMPIEGAACQGIGNPYEHYYGKNKPID